MVEPLHNVHHKQYQRLVILEMPPWRQLQQDYERDRTHCKLIKCIIHQSNTAVMRVVILPAACLTPPADIPQKIMQLTSALHRSQLHCMPQKLAHNEFSTLPVFLVACSSAPSILAAGSAVLPALPASFLMLSALPASIAVPSAPAPFAFSPGCSAGFSATFCNVSLRSIASFLAVSPSSSLSWWAYVQD